MHDSSIRRIAYAVIVAAVRGRRARGGDWGEAVLAEFAETNGDLEAVWWTLGGLRAAWHERRRRIQQLPRNVRVTRRAVAVLVIAVVAALAANQWVMTVHMAASGSMENTLLIGDRYLVDKIGFRVTGVHRGDVLEVSTPTSLRIKRVIGLVSQDSRQEGPVRTDAVRGRMLVKVWPFPG